MSDAAAAPSPPPPLPQQQTQYLRESDETAETADIALELPFPATSLSTATHRQFLSQAAIPARSNIQCFPRMAQAAADAAVAELLHWSLSRHLYLSGLPPWPRLCLPGPLSHIQPTPPNFLPPPNSLSAPTAHLQVHRVGHVARPIHSGSSSRSSGKVQLPPPPNLG